MKAISLLQPWASLVACGAKQIETRSWPTKYRGPIAIHASKGVTDEQRFSMMSYWHVQGGLAPMVGKPLDLTGKSWPGVKWDDLPLGLVLAVCDLVDCVPTDSLTLGQIRTDEHFGDFSPGRYAWLLKDIRRLDTPVPARGSLGLWNWEPPVEVQHG